MKKIIAILLGIELLIIAGIFGFEIKNPPIKNPPPDEINLGATYLFPYQGGTGTSTAPTYGQMLVGNSGGTYTLTATSSLGITATGDGASNWLKQTNYGVLNLTASTTIPYWAKDAFYASSTSVFQGLATFGNASTTQISATNSYLGTVLSGIWNGTALGNAYVDDDITLTNITQITNRAITDLTGTLTVSNGGTGQTSFTSSQILYGNGTAAISSVATTTPTMTAPLTYSGTLGSFVGGVAGTFDCTSATGSVKGCLASADWTTFNNKADLGSAMTGTFDSNNFAGGAIGAGELIYGGSAGSFSELALGTNGFVLALSGGIPAWVATTTLSTISGTLDISSQSNLTCGTNCTLTGDDISVDDAFILNTGDIGTGAYDFGGASDFEIPNGASPTVNVAGEIAVDTTSDQLIYYGGSKRVIPPLYYPAFTYSTSTVWTGSTSPQFLGTAMIPETWTFAECYTDAGTANVQISDGTNNMTMVPASTTPAKYALTTNNSFTAGEKRQFIAGTPATSPVKVSCTISKSYDAD